METFVKEFAGFGPVFLMVAWIMFLLRGQLIDLIKGGSRDTERLIAALDRMSDALTEQSENFRHNNQMFQQIAQVAHDMNAALSDIKAEIIRSAQK